MDFSIADDFTDALARLPAQEQKAVKTSAFDLQLDPSAPGLQFHEIHKSKNRNFWSARAGRDLRIIVHRTASSLLLVHVDHHDKAYAWAERRRIEPHPRTRRVQIVEEPEFGDWKDRRQNSDRRPPADAEPALFADRSDDDLLALGVPGDWLASVRSVDAAGWDSLSRHLPADVADRLEESYTGRRTLPVRESVMSLNIRTRGDLEKALAEPPPPFANYRRSAFEDYLVRHYRSARTGRGLDPRSAESYREYVARIAVTLRVNLEDALSEDRGLQLVEDNWVSEARRRRIPEKSIGNCRSGLRAYQRFLEFERAPDGSLDEGDR